MTRHSFAHWCQRAVAFARQQRGQGLVEYALIIAFVAIAIIGALGAFGTSLFNYYDYISTEIAAAGS